LVFLGDLFYIDILNNYLLVLILSCRVVELNFVIKQSLLHFNW